MINEHDNLECRCKRLGHMVSFRYCRTQEAESICPQILNCWWERFDVASFLKANLTDVDYAKLATPNPPKPKIQSIMELIETAKKRVSE